MAASGPAAPDPATDDAPAGAGAAHAAATAAGHATIPLALHSGRPAAYAAAIGHGSALA
jgi:hypothetical protein